MPDEFMPNIKQHISPRLLTNPDYESLRVELLEEISKDYQFSMRKSIGNSLYECLYHVYCVCVLVDYILKDPAEMTRLKINSIPQPYPRK